MAFIFSPVVTSRPDRRRSRPDFVSNRSGPHQYGSAIGLLLSLPAAVAALLASRRALSGSPRALSALLTLPQAVLTVLAPLVLLLAVLFSRLRSSAHCGVSPSRCVSIETDG